MASPLVLLDIGNSAVKWCVQTGGRGVLGREEYTTGFVSRLKAQWRPLADRPNKPRAGPASWRLVYSCVASEKRRDAILAAARHLFPGPLACLAAQPRVHVDAAPKSWWVECRYRRPETLGPDRWAAVLGLTGQTSRLSALVDAPHRPHQPPRSQKPLRPHQSSSAGPPCAVVWVVSAGTATVVDVVTVCPGANARSGRLRHEGGVILPGLGLMRDALSSATAALGVYVAAPAGVPAISGIPRQSQHAVAQGIAAAQLGPLLVLPRPEAVFVHGGAGRDWQACFQAVWSALGRPQPEKPRVYWTPGLVMEGLRQWAQRRDADFFTESV